MYRDSVQHHSRNQRDAKATKIEKKKDKKKPIKINKYNADTWRVSQSAGFVYIDQKKKIYVEKSDLKLPHQDVAPDPRQVLQNQ